MSSFLRQLMQSLTEPGRHICTFKVIPTTRSGPLLQLVADASRASDFYQVGGRLRSNGTTGEVTFVAFDLLVLDGETSASGRIGNAGPRSKHSTSQVRWCTIRALNAGPRELLDACAALDVEGVVAKRVDSPYRPRIRSGDWLKIKTAEWRSAHAPMRHPR
jgi:ATP-dependent DNA ligase